MRNNKIMYDPSLVEMMNNGRVNLSAPRPPSSSSVTQSTIPDYETTSESQFQQDMLRGNWEQNDLSRGFFSQKNLTTIQNALKKEVFDKSQPKGYVIDDQSVDEMKMIMRGIFYQYARNQPDNIQGQIQELNRRVLDWSVPHILSAVDHYMYYLKDVDTLPVPIAHPTHLSSAGTRSKPLGPFM
jgi:hypothetical protein